MTKPNIDLYSFRARVGPALFTILLPLVVFNHFFVVAELGKLIGDITSIKILANAGLTAVLLYFLGQLGRILGKTLFEKYLFQDAAYFPTTTYMLNSDRTYSSELKERFRSQVKKDFKIVLPEDADEVKLRQRISEAITMVRSKLHGNKILLQHNIEYGFARNALGGSIVGLMISVVNIIVFRFAYPAPVGVWISIGLSIIYISALLLSKPILNFYRDAYARILFREYIK